MTNIREELMKSRRYDAFGKADDSGDFVLIDTDFTKKMLVVIEAAKNVHGMEHKRGWTDHVPGLFELTQALAALGGES